MLIYQLFCDTFYLCNSSAEYTFYYLRLDMYSCMMIFRNLLRYIKRNRYDCMSRRFILYAIKTLSYLSFVYAKNRSLVKVSTLVPSMNSIYHIGNDHLSCFASVSTGIAGLALPSEISRDHL